MKPASLAVVVRKLPEGISPCMCGGPGMTPHMHEYEVFGSQGAIRTCCRGLVHVIELQSQMPDGGTIDSEQAPWKDYPILLNLSCSLPKVSS